jgi:hypothetical protein
MLELDADINDSRNALNEDVSGPLGISPSSSSYRFSCPSVASYKVDRRFKLLAQAWSINKMINNACHSSCQLLINKLS